MFFPYSINKQWVKGAKNNDNPQAYNGGILLGKAAAQSKRGTDAYVIE
jgi:hypothetical protein